jgi:hypothetical protein
MVEALTGTSSALDLHEVKPPLDAQRMVNWFEMNHHMMFPKNNLKSNNYSSQGTFNNLMKTNPTKKWGHTSRNAIY